ncbi:MAG: hypothetical protein ABSE20_00835 [Acetobacteraceae bacterium]|jgi:hypothetical protein
MLFDQQNILKRIKATLPVGWFGENTPILDTVLNSLAAGWVGLLGLLDYVTMQTRIGTATDGWLDLAATDYFGSRLQRRLQETDSSFRQRICMELLRDRCTRAAIYDTLLELTGRPPVIFEPTNPQDTGCYSTSVTTEIGCVGYGISGGWGNLNSPFQAFVTAYRPVGTGIAMINGWDGSIGGYGVGLSSYTSLNTNSAWADDPEIYETIARTAAVGSIIWTSVQP